jgi:predicted GNAT family N-acyltransferase
MIIRKHVFVDEQHCSADAEIDSDDTRSWHWVLYDTSTESSTPVGVIRLVPPPQTPHAHLTEPPAAVAQTVPEYDWTHEPCIKLTRVAIMPAFRGLGLGRRLVETALDWAAMHVAEIDEAAVQIAVKGKSPVATQKPWQGLVLVHAQVDVEAMYAGLGFETDEALGRWDEEGIEHVGMFRRVVLGK